MTFKISVYIMFLMSARAFAENAFYVVEQLKAQALLETYPAQIAEIDLTKNEIHWRQKNGEVRAETYDQFRGVRTAEELFSNPDIQDQLYHVYPLECRETAAPARDFDPGRSRHEGMLGRVWGATEAQVEARLKTIAWIGGQKIVVTRQEGVDQRFSALAKLFTSTEYASLRKFVENSPGAYDRRFIAGTKRLSSHSWGQAIDINLKYSNYWRWDMDSGGNFPYRNRIPCAVVREFEKLGFIWGGKWYHYDTMHFEYRPELLLFARKLREYFGADLPAIAKRAEIRLQ